MDLRSASEREVWFVYRLNFPFSNKGELVSMENIKQLTIYIPKATRNKWSITEKKKYPQTAPPHLLQQNQAKMGSNLKVCCVINKESSQNQCLTANHSPIFQCLACQTVRGISPLNAVDETMNVHRHHSDHFLANPSFPIFWNYFRLFLIRRLMEALLDPIDFDASYRIEQHSKNFQWKSIETVPSLNSLPLLPSMGFPKPWGCISSRAVLKVSDWDRTWQQQPQPTLLPIDPHPQSRMDQGSSSWVPCCLYWCTIMSDLTILWFRLQERR